jgi:hypothetical protein
LLSPDEERVVLENESGSGAYKTNDIEGEADSGVSFILPRGWSKLLTSIGGGR